MPIIRDLIASQTGRRSNLPRLASTRTSVGLSVDAERALQIGAVYACVRLISEGIAQLPVHLYRRTTDGRAAVTDHPLVPLLTDRPNPDIDAGEFWRTMVGWMLLRGNAIAYREVDSGGRTRALWPIAPTSVELQRLSNGSLAYAVTLNDAEYVPGFKPQRERVVQAPQVLHYRAFGLGTWGLSPVGLHRTKVAVAYAAEEYGAGFFSRGAHPGGVLATDNSLSDEQFERLDKQWKDTHGGFANSNAPAILEAGLKWQNVGLPPIEAQFLETQKYTAAAIAGQIFGVPPHMIGDVERSTSWGSGIAEQGIGFVRYTLMPWLVRLERVTNQLLAERDLYTKFNTAALERGDLKSRYDAYAVGRQWGFKSANDIKKLEDEEPIGPAGDVYLQPLNMVPAGTFDEPRAGGRAVRATSKLRDRHEEAHRQALVRYFDDLSTEILADRGRSQQARDVDRDEWDRRLARLLAQLGLAAAVDAGTEVAERFSVELDEGGFAGWMSAMGRRVAELVNDTTFAAVSAAADDDALGQVLDNLVAGRAAQIATSRVADAFGFGRLEAAEQAGAGTKTWRTRSGNPRSEHARIDGETVPIGETFSNGARWPGDKTLNVDERANCKCDMEIST